MMDEETVRLNELCVLAHHLGLVTEIDGATDVPKLNSDGGLADEELDFADEEPESDEV